MSVDTLTQLKGGVSLQSDKMGIASIVFEEANNPLLSQDDIVCFELKGTTYAANLAERTVKKAG